MLEGSVPLHRVSRSETFVVFEAVNVLFVVFEVDGVGLILC